MSWQSSNQTKQPLTYSPGAWQNLLNSRCSCSPLWGSWEKATCAHQEGSSLFQWCWTTVQTAAAHFLLLGSSRVRPAQSCLKSWLPGDGRLCPVWGQEKDRAVCEGEIRAEISVLSSLSALPATFQSRQQHDRHRAELAREAWAPTAWDEDQGREGCAMS